MPVAAWARVVSGEYCRARLEPDYFLRAKQLRPELLRALVAEGKHGAFWGIENEW